jgi:hypothetical protein
MSWKKAYIHTGSFGRGCGCRGGRLCALPVPARLAHVIVAALDAAITEARINLAATHVAAVPVHAVHWPDHVRVTRQPLGSQARKARRAHVKVAAARAPKAALRVDRSATHVARVMRHAAHRANVVRVNAQANGSGGGTRGSGRGRGGRLRRCGGVGGRVDQVFVRHDGGSALECRGLSWCENKRQTWMSEQ